jgi:hypothetical protein
MNMTEKTLGPSPLSDFGSKVRDARDAAGFLVTWGNDFLRGVRAGIVGESRRSGQLLTPPSS